MAMPVPRTPCRCQPRQKNAATGRTPRTAAARTPRAIPHLEIVRRYEPDLEAELQAIALLLGIRLLPPSPQSGRVAA